MNPTQRLTDLLLRHTGCDQLRETAIPGLRLMRCSFPSQPLYASGGPSLALVVQGAKSLQDGEVELKYGPGQYLLTSVGLPFVSRILAASPEKPMLGLGISILPDELAQVTRRVQNFATAGAGVTVNQAEPELLEAIVRLAGLLDTPEHIPGLAPIYLQEVLYRLLVGPSGARLLQLSRLDSPSNRIATALERLRQSYSEPLKVETLAQEAGMSPATFHLHFKAVSRFTPIQFQKALRLHEARRLMLVERRDVGEAGYRVGYQSPSQFSKEYRRYFGAAPSEDIRCLRQAGGVSWAGDTYLPLPSPAYSADTHGGQKGSQGAEAAY